MAIKKQSYNAFLCALLSCFIAVLGAGCAKKQTTGDIVLAKVGNRTITLGAFKEKIDRLPAYYREAVLRDKKRFLEETIIESLFYEEAIRKGVDSDPEVKDVLREAKKKVVIAKLVGNEVDKKIRIGDAEIKAYYDTHRDEFNAEELWRASHILVSDQNKAEELLGRLKQGEDFAELARVYSIDATAARGGDVGYFRAGQVVPEFETASGALNPGEVSGIVKSQFGYHIIKLTDRRNPRAESIDRVKPKIEAKLAKEKRNILFDKLVLSLKEKYHAEVAEGASKYLDSIGGTDKETEGPAQ